MPIRYLLYILLTASLYLSTIDTVHGQRCREELLEGYCFFDSATSFNDAFTFAEVLAATDLRQPPAAGAANALLVKDLLADSVYRDWINTAYHQVVLQLQAAYSQEELCDHVILNYASTKFEKTPANGLKGAFSFHIARKSRCYESNSYPSLVFKFSANATKNKLLTSERFPRINASTSRPKTIQEVCIAEGIFFEGDLLDGAYFSKDTSRLNCLSCMDGYNTVLYTREPLEILSKYRDASVGLAYLDSLTKIKAPEYVPLEFKIIGYHEVLLKGELIPYYTAKVIAKSSKTEDLPDTLAFFKEWRIKNSYSNRQTTEKIDINYTGYAKVTPSLREVGIGKASGLPVMDLLGNPVQSSFYRSTGQLDEVYKVLQLKRIGEENNIKVSAHAWFDAYTDTVTYLANIYTDDPWADLSTWNIEIEYDIAKLGSYLVKNGKVTLKSIVSKQSSSSFKKQSLINIEFSEATDNYTFVISDRDSSHLLVQVSQKKGTKPIRILDNQTRSVDPGKVLSLFILQFDSSHLVGGDILTFSAQNSNVKAYISDRKKVPIVDSVYSTKVGSKEIVTFVGKYLNAKDLIFWVPCGFADKDVPIVGYCNIQPWHQRGQRLVSDTSSFIMPPSFSHGMSARTHLVPRCGNLLLKSRYAGEAAKSVLMFCDEKSISK